MGENAAAGRQPFQCLAGARLAPSQCMGNRRRGHPPPVGEGVERGAAVVGNGPEQKRAGRSRPAPRRPRVQAAGRACSIASTWSAPRPWSRTRGTGRSALATINLATTSSAQEKSTRPTSEKSRWASSPGCVAQHHQHAIAHRRPGLARDQIAVGCGDRFAQDEVESDDGVHSAASFAGMMIVTCAPGNHARLSVRGGSSSHDGAKATRAVPLRIEIFACQRER